jgi:hypothetical protein
MYPSLRILALGGMLLLGAGPARAQLAESPFTVAPGRWLLEMDVLSRETDRSPGHRYTGWGAGAVLLSTGLREQWDVQVGLELFASEKIETGGVIERYRGRGDLWLRTKWCFFQNPESGMALAVIPYLKFPTNTGGVGNDAIEAGIALPMAFKLAEALETAVTMGFDGLRNAQDDGHEAHGFITAAVMRALSTRLGVYAEVSLARAPGGAPVEMQGGLGLTWVTAKVHNWDFAVYRGLSRGAVDWVQVLRYNIEF